MANIEQKRADLEKALQAINEDEMETVAGGLSEKAKNALRVGGALATVTLMGYIAYKKPWKKDSSLTATATDVSTSSQLLYPTERDLTSSQVQIRGNDDDTTWGFDGDNTMWKFDDEQVP